MNCFDGENVYLSFLERRVTGFGMCQGSATGVSVFSVQRQQDIRCSSSLWDVGCEYRHLVPQDYNESEDAIITSLKVQNQSKYGCSASGSLHTHKTDLFGRESSEKLFSANKRENVKYPAELAE